VQHLDVASSTLLVQLSYSYAINKFTCGHSSSLHSGDATDPLINSTSIFRTLYWEVWDSGENQVGQRQTGEAQSRNTSKRLGLSWKEAAAVDRLEWRQSVGHWA